MFGPTLHCDCTPVHETKYEPSSPHSVPRTVVEAIATAAEASPTDIEPLYETVDLEALERFVEHAAVSPSDPSVVVAFVVDEWTVFVHSDGRVVVCDSVGGSAESATMALGSLDPVEFD